ncbi:isoprenylcysteine carboxylmethyltransferase family protein [Mycobacterium sp. pUA109]|uniref:isoprenylcysteine carboxylmethyltransferase family protein n=1 Tax=Mycobacterium sp. pUA109 TaxID=3238982 RepID=UPI00351AB141
MRRSVAAAGTATFFVVAPGTVVGVIPWLISRWELAGFTPAWRLAQAVGVLLIVIGLVPLVHSFVQFAKALGTPMPLAPTQHLVITGFYRFVRNPMYVGLLFMIVGQAVLFGSPGVLLYAAIAWVVTAAFIRWYEEPTLARQYGSQYDEYRRNVPAWLPRWRPWMPPRQS